MGAALGQETAPQAGDEQVLAAVRVDVAGGGRHAAVDVRKTRRGSAFAEGAVAVVQEQAVRLLNPPERKNTSCQPSPLRSAITPLPVISGIASSCA